MKTLKVIEIRYNKDGTFNLTDDGGNKFLNCYLCSFQDPSIKPILYGEGITEETVIEFQTSDRSPIKNILDNWRSKLFEGG